MAQLHGEHAKRATVTLGLHACHLGGIVLRKHADAHQQLSHQFVFHIYIDGALAPDLTSRLSATPAPATVLPMSLARRVWIGGYLGLGLGTGIGATVGSALVSPLFWLASALVGLLGGVLLGLAARR